MPKTASAKKANTKTAAARKSARKTAPAKTLPKKKPLAGASTKAGSVKTPRADDALLADLTKRLGKIAMKLPRVDQKKLFGCDGFFAEGGIFALVWKTGRIGVKLTDTAAYRELRGAKGSDPWKAGPKEMAHWVLVPTAFHEDAKALARWVERAYRLAGIDA